VDGIWDVDSVGLVELVAGLNQGTDCNGLPLATKTSFHAGARFNPSAAALEAEISRTASKIQAGARFLISRPVYELRMLRIMMDALSEHDIPVLLSIVPLRSFEEADYCRTRCRTSASRSRRSRRWSGRALARPRRASS